MSSSGLFCCRLGYRTVLGAKPRAIIYLTQGSMLTLALKSHTLESDRNIHLGILTNKERRQ